MSRKKKVEAVQEVPNNLSMTFLQRRYDMLLRDMDALRERSVPLTPTPEELQLKSELELARDLLAQAEEDRAELRDQVKSLTSKNKELEERVESEEARNVELEGQVEQLEEGLEEGLEERFCLLVKAEASLRSVLGREDCEDSWEKFQAFRVLEDISDEVR